MTWTPEMIARVKQLRLQGISCKSIGERYGVSRQAVQRVLDRNRDDRAPAPAKWPQEAIDLIERARKVKAPYSDIVLMLREQLGIEKTRNACIGIARRMGFDVPADQREKTLTERRAREEGRPRLGRQKRKRSNNRSDLADLWQVRKQPRPNYNMRHGPPVVRDYRERQPALGEPEPIGRLNDFGKGCKWPARGRVADGDYRECGHPRTEGSVYCPFHDHIAYTSARSLDHFEIKENAA